MPKDPRIKKVLVIGSGPIIIGQAAEFDYSGTQACRALKAEGIETVLLNSNPATIMTDPDVADHVYIEPMTLEVVERILDIEKPDSVLPNLGGQMGLNLSMELARSGYLDRTGIRLLACKPETIDRAEDRELFKETMEKLHQPIIPSEVVETLQDALACANRIGYPVIVRPAFTMGGTGGGICETKEKLIEIGTNGLRLSPIHQILVEKCIAGWKEIEYEVMRDHKGNVITVCNMENLDPVGIHTGDSVVVAPSQTLTDHEYQMLRTAALDIITELGIEGGCNCQFALKPDSFDYAVIEVNPRVSRSSALASKATGYPIAKVATKIAIGYTLDEITNDVTGKTCACFEPALDYIVVKYPKWPFDKFVYADKSLGTQMMATGEVMSIGNSFEAAMMKAVSSIELGMDTLTHKPFEELTDDEIVAHLHVQDAERVFCVYEALKRGIDHQTIYRITKIDWWFLDKMQHLANLENGLAKCNGQLSLEQYKTAKKYGFQDKTIKRLAKVDKLPVENYRAGFKMVDTCAAEFSANTPYFYSTYDGDNEAAEFIAEKEAEAAAKGEPKKKKVLVFGSGPIRIGQGIEFDYCSVHCVWTLKKHGCEAILVNNNPETVSTDFDTGDRLYFDPLNPESVDNIIATEKPDACVVQFGGQTAIKLAKHMDEIGLPILGTPADAIDEAEDRERFDELLERCNIPRAPGRTVFNLDEALAAAEEIGLPVLMRPSYVLGGQNMIVAYNKADIIEYMGVITEHVDMDHPVLLDKYIMGTECEVDAICDGENFLIPGIMEQVELTGVHSGDSICVYPAQHLTQDEIGLPILGTPADAIDEAEDRERFDELLERCKIPRAPGRTVFNLDEALAAADEIGLPVLMRPSYVLGGQNMIVAYTKADVIEYMGVITEHVDMDHPVLLDKYIMGTECEVDAICDGENFLIPGIMEQVERTGVHSGDSICVYPAQHLTQAEIDTMVDYTGRFARELHVTGLVNVQYAVSNGKVYVIEVNPRSSRTVPYISKVTGVPMVDLAVRCCLGEKLTDMGYGTGLHPNAPYVAVKVPVFSFEKLHGVDTQFGPEMKSTGEVLGIAPNFHDALLKGLIGAGYTFKTPGPASCCIFTVKDSDKPEFVDIAWKLKSMGYKLYGTSGTCAWLNKHMVPCNEVRPMSGESPNIVDLLQSGLVDYVFSTSAKGRDPKRDSVRLRRKAVELSIPCITAVDTANALVNCLRSDHSLENIPLVDIATLYHRK